MEKRLFERMADNAARENKSNSRLNLAAFILLRDEIYEAINAGWSVRYTWEVLYKEEKITFGYQTFLNFVNKYKPNATTKSKKVVAQKEIEILQEQTQKPLLEAEQPSKQDSTQERMKKAALPNDPKKDYGNPKGFEWSADYDPKDLL